MITPTAVEPDDPRSYYSVSRRLSEETPNAILAGESWNAANPEAHYRTTGPELWRQTGARIRRCSSPGWAPAARSAAPAAF